MGRGQRQRAGRAWDNGYLSAEERSYSSVHAGDALFIQPLRHARSPMPRNKIKTAWNEAKNDTEKVCALVPQPPSRSLTPFHPFSRPSKWAINRLQHCPMQVESFSALGGLQFTYGSCVAVGSFGFRGHTPPAPNDAKLLRRVQCR